MVSIYVCKKNSEYHPFLSVGRGPFAVVSCIELLTTFPGPADRPNGEAFVTFNDAAEAGNAKQAKDKECLGNRYIE